MAISIPSWLARAALSALILPAAGCGTHRASTLTVEDLMGDRVTLDGLLLKCNQQPSSGTSDPSCVNARVAGDRLAAREDALRAAAREDEFERQRERLRLADEERRQGEEAKKVDAYHMPLVPLDGAPPPTASVNP